MRKSTDIVNDINLFTPEDDNWLVLDGLISELWATKDQEKYIKELLAVFERFPEEDGSGVFWSIVHGIETFKSYENELLESLTKQPSEMGIIMLQRILNSGTKTIGSRKINEVIMNLAQKENLSDYLKKYLTELRAN